MTVLNNDTRKCSNLEKRGHACNLQFDAVAASQPLAQTRKTDHSPKKADLDERSRSKAIW